VYEKFGFENDIIFLILVPMLASSLK